MSPTLPQKLTAEAIGTAILVFIGAGSVPLTVFLTAGAGGTGIDGTAGLSTISFAFAFAIFAAIYSVGHISGCHINPAVTIALLATRKIDAATAASYIAAQLVGAFIGAGLTFIILTGNDPQTLGLGAVGVNEKAGLLVGFAAEVIGTAIGLAEYTNGNFLSQDTIFEDFALPREQSLEAQPSVAEGGGQSVD